jgi:ribosomal protein L35AE/L33A
LSQIFFGKITNYQTGPNTQASKVCLIEFKGITSSGLAGKLVGHKVIWKNQTASMVGKITGTHGRNGMVKVRFKHGVPGQAIGSTVKLTT